jgi:hypothetical protein
MYPWEYLTHQRTLLGAVDTYVSDLVHTRPHLAAAHRARLEDFAEWWLEEQGGANDIRAISAAQVRDYLTRIEPSGASATAVRSFFDWARAEHLIDASDGPCQDEGVPSTLR